MRIVSSISLLRRKWEISCAASNEGLLRMQRASPDQDGKFLQEVYGAVGGHEEGAVWVLTQYAEFFFSVGKMMESISLHFWPVLSPRKKCVETIISSATRSKQIAGGVRSKKLDDRAVEHTNLSW